MGVWASIFGAGIASPIEAIGKVVDEVHTSDEERAAAKIVMERLRQEPGKLQAAINMIEAQHRSVFVAGWRPFIGWVCGAGLAWKFVFYELIGWLALTAGGPAPPQLIGVSELIPLVIALLGLGAYRTGEKLAGKTK